MKIALITVPQPCHLTQKIMPPLAIAYLAALLEQQRHIVRIYDLALHLHEPMSRALTPARLFRPHLLVVAAHNDQVADHIALSLADYAGQIVRLKTPLRDMFQCLPLLDTMAVTEGHDASVIQQALDRLHRDTPELPFPARHLLELEGYRFRSTGDGLQTPLLIRQPLSRHEYSPRPPSGIVAEMQAIAREHAIRHVSFEGAPVTWQRQWFEQLLDALTAADLGMVWEARAEFTQLDAELLARCKAAGCEALILPIVTDDVLLTMRGREEFARIAQLAQQHGILVHADIALGGEMNRLPALVDIAATFNLDRVSFSPRHEEQTVAMSVLGAMGIAETLIDQASRQYQACRVRYQFIKRFGNRLGSVLWRIGEAGLLGANWQRYA